jgi:cytoskeletal protein RodZ
MTEVGDYLKKERESKRLSVHEVAERTKISKHYLVCIENGDYDQLPPGPYAKGYIAAYARQVCGDETQALELFAAGQSAAMPPVSDTGAGISVQPGGATPPSNGDNGAPWSVSTGKASNLLRTMRQAIHKRGNLRRRSNQESQDRPSPGTRRISLAGSPGKAMAPLARFFTGYWRKGGLLAGVMLLGGAVLLLAGFGVYHLLFFQNRPVAMVEPQESASQPPAVAASAEEVATVPSTATAPAAAPKPKVTETPAIRDAKSVEGLATYSAKPAKITTRGAAQGPQREASGGNATPLTDAEPKVAAEAAPATKTTPAPENRLSTPAMAVQDQEHAAPPPLPLPAAPETPVADIPFRLLKASVCTAIGERMPVGVSERFPWTTPKIFVWSLLSASGPPAKVRHIYYHEGNMVSDVILKVGSSYWRTWSFHTLSGQLHIGPWHVDIATLDGRVLRRLHFAIE